MTGMENVLAAHQYAFTEYDEDGQDYFGCKCGDEQQENDDHDDISEWHAAHVAEALTLAGFGNLHDAWAEGRKSALNKLSNDSANPYPKVSEP